MHEVLLENEMKSQFDHNKKTVNKLERDENFQLDVETRCKFCF